MKIYKLLLALVISSLLLSCDEEEMPSQIPTKPQIYGVQNEYHCIGNSMSLSVVGSTVEDDLIIDYVYYISTDNQHFYVTPSDVTDMRSGTQYWWYAVAVAKNFNGKVIGTSEASDVYTFYCDIMPDDTVPSQPSVEPTVQKGNKVIIVPIGNVEGISISSDTVYGDPGENKKVTFSLDDEYEISDITGGEISVDGTTLNVTIGKTDYYVFVEVRKKATSVVFYLYQFKQAIDDAPLLDTKVIADVNIGDVVTYQIPDEYSGYYIASEYSNIWNLYLYSFEKDYKSISFEMVESKNIEYSVYIDTISTVFYIYKDNKNIASLPIRNGMSNVNYSLDLSEYLGADYQIDSYETYNPVNVSIDGNDLKYSFNNVGQYSVSVYLKKIQIPCENHTSTSLLNRFFCTGNTGYEFVRDSESGKIVMNAYEKNSSGSIDKEVYEFVKFNGDESDFLKDDEKYQIWVEYDNSRECYYIQITRYQDKWTDMGYFDEVASHEAIEQALLQ